MRKVLLVLLIAFVFASIGCEERIEIYQLSPPSWIQGRYNGHGFELSVFINADNFIVESPSMAINLKEMISGGHYNVSDGSRIIDTGLGRRSYFVELESQGIIVRYELEYTFLSESGLLKITYMGITQSFNLGSRIR